MGCAGSTEDNQGQAYTEEAAVKVKDSGAAADPGPNAVEDANKYPAPTGEQFWVVVGDKIRLSAYLQYETTVKNVVEFCNWYLTKNKDSLPAGYGALEDHLVTGLTSPHVMADGLIFCPEDQIHELDGWDEGERYLVALNSKWKIANYTNECDIERIKKPEVWSVHKAQSTGLDLEHHTDLRSADIPDEFRDDEKSADA